MDDPNLSQIPDPTPKRPESEEQLTSIEVDLSKELETIDLSKELSSFVYHTHVLEYREKLAGVKTREHELTTERQMLGLRKKYATGLFLLMIVWLVFIGKVVASSGTGKWCGHAFNLSDGVVIALITTTTVNVLGLFYIVAKWLFPNGIPLGGRR
jgi:hypothetical protein